MVKEAESRDARTTSPNSNNISPKDAAITIIVSVVQVGLTCIGSYYLSRFINKAMNGSPSSAANNSSRETKDRLERILLNRAIEEEKQKHGDDADCIDEEEIMLRVKRKAIKSLGLSEYETIIAEDVIDPTDINVAFKDVGGIDGIKTELFDLVVLPILRPDLFQSDSGLVTPPRGILLYGAPGTGKTMLAKAIAKESGASFVNVRLSNIMNKWFGESNKLISATFSLAKKLAPSVIFIDEIDTFLNQRDSGEGSATTSMKSEFLTLWDGMTTDINDDAPITVLGATNRPYDVDSAILRRLPRTFEIGLPDFESRLQILNLYLKDQPLTTRAREIIPAIAKSTAGYSGSDLKELCRAAAMQPIREITQRASRRAVTEMNKSQTNKSKKRQDFGPAKGQSVRPVNEKDFALALKKVKRTGEAAQTFRKSESENLNANNNMNVDMNDLARTMKMLHALMGMQQNGRDQSNEAELTDDDYGIPSMSR